MCILIYMFKTLFEMFYSQEFVYVHVYNVILIFSGLRVD